MEQRDLEPRAAVARAGERAGLGVAGRDRQLDRSPPPSSPTATAPRGVVSANWRSMRAVAPSTVDLRDAPHHERDDERRRRRVLDLDHDRCCPRPAAPYTRWIASPLGTRIEVSTTGASSTRCCRTATSLVGRRQRSSAPIHHSSVHPRRAAAPCPRDRRARARPPPSVPTPIMGSVIGTTYRIPSSSALAARPMNWARKSAGAERPSITGAHHLRDRQLDVVVPRQRHDAARGAARPRPPSACRRGSPRADDPARTRHPTRRFRLCSLVHVATRSPTPASPAKVSGSPPSATPSRVISASPRVMSAARRVVAEPEAGRGTHRDRDHVLHRAGDLAPHHVGVRVHAERRGHEQLLELRTDVGVARRHHRRRRLALGDLAHEVRSGEHRDRVGSTRGSTRLDDLAHPGERSLLDALGEAHDQRVGRDRRRRVGRARRGTRATAPPSRRRRRSDARLARDRPSRRSVASSAMPGRYRGFSWPRVDRRRPAPGSRPQSTTSAFALQRWANVVPHDPAPITASRVTNSLRSGRGIERA